MASYSSAVGSLSRARLDALVEEATVDCYNEDEQLTGLFTMIDENLAVPFTTRVLGVEVTVRRVDLVGSEVMAVCHRGRTRQLIGLLDLPLPDPPPEGVECIEAYRYWAR
jgi:calcium binding protein